MVDQTVYDIITAITEKYNVSLEELIACRDGEATTTATKKKVRARKPKSEKRPVSSYEPGELPRKLWWAKFLKTGFAQHKAEGGTKSYKDYMAEAQTLWADMSDEDKSRSVNV